MELPIWVCVALAAMTAGLLAWALWLTVRVRRLRRALDTVETRSGYRLSVVVLNPRKLARERSPVGARMAVFAPGLVTRRVYEVVARELGEELAARGVEAQIEIHRPR